MIRRLLLLPIFALVVMNALPAAAQLGGSIPPPGELVKIEAAPVDVKAGGEARVRVRLAIAPTWHINANPPFPDYMIPTELEVPATAGITPGTPTYPAPHMVKLSFDDSELFVYDGSVDIVLPVRVAKDAANGTRAINATLRFQACNDQVCLPPHKLPVALTLNVSGGSDAPVAASGDGAPAPSGTSPEPETPALDSGGTLDAGGATDAAAPAPARGFTSGPPAAGAGVENPISRALEQGSIATFLVLFGIGLAMNLTPCVYPMLGVTVSIFGARGSAKPVQAFGMALVYVLGIATMYSVLGVAAALSGGLFGAALQSPVVLVGIGILLIGMSLSMFGLYELQLPPQLMSKLGGHTATGVAGVFGSGLLVGVFAAPCIGPPIVALLAIVGAKGDPMFGFLSFFVLSIGLGLPYLILGTFSSLLSRLPKSGEWMIWVKKVFGIVLLAIGLFYAALAFAPKLSFWIAPLALLLGGIYLGFIDRSRGRTPAFGIVKRVGGAAAVIAGGVMAAALMPKGAMEFEAYDEVRLRAALDQGRPVLMDFSADWCVPCHELERFTFTDRRVIAAAADFERFKVDLTRYDSAESEKLRADYAITGVPTIVFLSPDGSEVRAARVEGFLPPEPFLERMQTAAAGGPRAQR